MSLSHRTVFIKFSLNVNLSLAYKLALIFYHNMYYAFPGTPKFCRQSLSYARKSYQDGHILFFGRLEILWLTPTLLLLSQKL